jgi:2-polyprenyl-3-methyl-5-hydroxy-6-metoxy-1,4-benzoquinol methylase
MRRPREEMVGDRNPSAADTAAEERLTQWREHHPAEDLIEVNCPLCAMEGRRLIAREWGLGVVQCTACSLVYVSPRLRHAQENYRTDANAKLQKYGRILAGEAPHPRDKNYLEHWQTLARVRPTGRVLDVGSHLGFFLRLGRNRGWTLQGIEPSAQSARIGSAAFGLDIRCGYLQDAHFPPDSFDVVTLVDVLEHVVEPRLLLAEIRRVLAPDGVLFIKVPNARYNLLKQLVLRKLLNRSGHDIFDSREHVVHYTAATLSRMLREAGFSRPRFYVPRPIQTGSYLHRAARAVLNAAARISPIVAEERLIPPTDLAVIAWKA